MKNYLEKSLIELGEFKEEKNQNLYGLINRVNQACQIKLQDLEVENLRVLVSQEIGLKYCIELAIDFLENNILSEGDFYPGDLLIALVSIQSQTWDSHPKSYERLSSLIKENWEIIEQKKLDRKINPIFINN